MGTTHDPQLLKGVLSPLLLWLLAERESYGYELVQRLRAAGLSGISEGTVYPALSRLEREGRITSRLGASRSGPARQYHRPPHSRYTRPAQATAALPALAATGPRPLSPPLPPP